MGATKEPDFMCVVCGLPASIHQMKVSKGHTRRTRICPNGHGFKTYQNGGGECFDCHLVAGINRNSTEYRQMKRTYLQLALVCEVYATPKIQACLERARQKAGVMR